MISVNGASFGASAAGVADIPALPNATVSWQPSCGRSRTGEKLPVASNPHDDTPVALVDKDPLRTSPTFHQVNPDKGYRRSHIGPPPQPDKPAASLGNYCSAVLNGEDAGTLARWLRHRFGAEVNATTEEAAFIWLPKPPLPVDYPETASDLRALAVATGQDAAAALGQAALGEPDHLVAILGALGRGGPGLIAVKARNPRFLRSRPRSATDPLSKGFRPGRAPKSLLLDRYFGTGSVVRSSVQRADANWVHGRGRDLEIAEIIHKPNWNTHGRAAPFRRNDELLNLLPKGIVAFPGPGITDNLVEKAMKLGIPVQRCPA